MAKLDRSKLGNLDQTLQNTPAGTPGEAPADTPLGTSGDATADAPIIIEGLDTFLDNLDVEIIIPRSTTLTEKQVDEILEKFSKQQEVSINEAKVFITILFQSGGTSKSCDGNLSCTAFGKTVKLAYLRKALTESKVKGSERKLARYLASEIAKIATKLKIPGNLTKKMTRNQKERVFTLEETVWLSDFQVDNKDCPEILRNFISDSFEIKGNKTPQNKPDRKKTGK